MKLASLSAHIEEEVIGKERERESRSPRAVGRFHCIVAVSGEGDRS